MISKCRAEQDQAENAGSKIERVPKKKSTPKRRHPITHFCVQLQILKKKQRPAN